MHEERASLRQRRHRSSAWSTTPKAAGNESTPCAAIHSPQEARRRASILRGIGLARIRTVRRRGQRFIVGSMARRHRAWFWSKRCVWICKILGRLPQVGNWFQEFVRSWRSLDGAIVRSDKHKAYSLSEIFSIHECVICRGHGCQRCLSVQSGLFTASRSPTVVCGPCLFSGSASMDLIVGWQHMPSSPAPPLYLCRRCAETGLRRSGIMSNSVFTVPPQKQDILIK